MISYPGAKALICLLPLAACGAEPDRDDRPRSNRQAEVAARGASVMPFDLNRTTHHFKPSPWGGIQQVTSKDDDTRQIGLARSHLREEAERFRHGDFSSPARIHDSDMPGLAQLRESAGRLRIEYSDVPEGGQIRYSSSDAELVRALHAWFEAQLSDHGNHATGHGH